MEETGLRDYAFYKATEQAPRRLGWLVRPMRRMLRRLLGPVWQREYELFVALGADLERLERNQTDVHGRLEAAIDAAIDARFAELEHRQMTALGDVSDRLSSVEQRQDSMEQRQDSLEQRQMTALGHLSDRLDSLERQLRAAIALGWDHEAVVRRLATIEGRLNEMHEGSAVAREVDSAAP
jgi:chromosome segregation ATPase